MTRWTVLGLLLILGLGSACATTKQARHIKNEGALLIAPGLLQKGTGDEPGLYYVDESADWKGYSSIQVDPVSIWRSEDSGIHVSQADAQAMADAFHVALTQALGNDFKLVNGPGPGALRLTVVLTDLRKEHVVLNTISTVVPQVRLLAMLEGAATGRPLFTGDVGMAFKVVDGSSGKLLEAGVTERVGTRHFTDLFSTWANIRAAFVYWGEQFSYEFCQNQERTNCTAPSLDQVP